MRFLTFALPVAIMLMAGAVRAATLEIGLLLSDTSPPYQQFAEVFKNTLAIKRIDATVSVVHSGDGANPDLIVAVGIKAAQSAIASFEAPVLGVMVPSVGYEALLASQYGKAQSKQMSAIFIEQPMRRQLDFIRSALPERRRLGLLYSPNSDFLLAGLKPEAETRGFSLVPVQSSGTAETLFAGLQEVLGASDVLLSIPDSSIYNSSNVRNILLLSYQHKVPMVGISQAYVSAGALCAIFSTPAQIAEQAGELVATFSKSSRLPDPQYPASFSIGLNPQVARSLGIILDSEKTIRERMGEATGGGK